MAEQGGLNNFSIKLPPGWEDQTIYTYMGPEDSGVQHILTLSIDPYAKDIDLAAYAEQRRIRVLDTMPSVEVLKDEETKFANGSPAYEIVFKMVPTDGNVIFRKMVFLKLNGIVYTFAANFSKKTIKTIGTEVDRIIDSFTPLKGLE
jgi:hypothetical protein